MDKSGPAVVVVSTNISESLLHLLARFARSSSSCLALAILDLKCLGEEMTDITAGVHPGNRGLVLDLLNFDVLEEPFFVHSFCLRVDASFNATFLLCLMVSVCSVSSCQRTHSSSCAGTSCSRCVT